MKNANKTYDFYSLKPPKEVFSMRILPTETTKIVNGARKRDIFSHFDYDPEEKLAISAIKLQVSSEIRELSDELALKCYYCSGFSVDKAARLLEKLGVQRFSLETGEFSTKLESFLATGLLYQLGRDLKYRPIVVIDLSKLEKINDFALTKKALMQLLYIVEKYMFFPGFVEKWTVLVDCRDFPKNFAFDAEDLAYFLKEFAEMFPFSLEKLFVVEPTFEILEFLKRFEGKFDKSTMEKVVFLENRDLKAILAKFIAKDQLQVKFGGVLSNKREFWPPKTTFSQTNYSLAPSRVSSQEFVSAKSSVSQEKIEHYQEFSLDSRDFFFELQQKDAFYDSAAKIQRNRENPDKSSCFGPCFANSNRTTIIDLQENSGKKGFCAVF